METGRKMRRRSPVSELERIDKAIADASAGDDQAGRAGRERQDAEMVGWAVRHGLRSALAQIPERLHAEVERRWAEQDSLEAQERRRLKLIESARRKGEGVLSLDGQVVVEARRQPVAASADPLPERSLKPGEQFPRAG
jgi:FAD/FMN-containing dehydrogenase